jgi:hypothetical protein
MKRNSNAAPYPSRRSIVTVLITMSSPDDPARPSGPFRFSDDAESLDEFAFTSCFVFGLRFQQPVSGTLQRGAS